MHHDLDALDVDAARDLQGRALEPWIRRVGVALVALVPVLGLLNVFGQHELSSYAASTAATMRLNAPADVRGGLLFGATVTIHARAVLPGATLVLSHGWADGFNINTIEPGPVSETSRRGDLVFGLGRLAAGQTYALHMQFQVDPTSVGGRVQDVTLMSDGQPVLLLSHHMTVWP
jgi:hypothetical protein